MNRLQRFRAYMARMNPIADPRQAIRDGLYVPPPGLCTAEMITRAMELEPTSKHLVVGGIGSGKTSELLVAAKKLRTSLANVGDHTEFIDISKKHDLAAPKLTGVLLALVGEGLSKRLPKERGKTVAAAVERLEKHAHGFDRWVSHIEDDGPPDPDDWFDPSNPGEMVRVPGVLVPPDHSAAELESAISALLVVRNAYPGAGKHAVFLVDALDRLHDAARFREAVEKDLLGLTRAEIGLVLVGPARFMSGTDRSVLDLFDHVHFRLAVDPLTNEGSDFLKKVLRARADAQMLPDETIVPLIEASGGTLRDLIQLAKRAGEESYASGRDHVDPGDVALAIEAFGRSLAVGLDKTELRAIRRVLSGKGMTITSETDLSLIETRRVLLYEGNVWRVHPALAPLVTAGSDE